MSVAPAGTWTMLMRDCALPRASSTHTRIAPAVVAQVRANQRTVSCPASGPPTVMMRRFEAEWAVYRCATTRIARPVARQVVGGDHTAAEGPDAVDPT